LFTVQSGQIQGEIDAMTVSPEVEELVKQAMLVGDYDSEDAVLLAALQALAERQQTEEVKRPQITPLGLKLREIRAQYISGGGDLLTVEQLDREIAQRRGQRDLGE
jgi:hypothetical protein